jgi:hypothetical protein
MRGRLRKLADDALEDQTDLAAELMLPDLDNTDWSSCDFAREFEQCQSAAFALSDAVSRRYFSHASSGNISLGA